MLLESYALIQHLSSKRWLHLEKNGKKFDLKCIVRATLSSAFIDKYCRRNFSPNDSGLKGLQWDSAELYQVCTC